MLLIILFIQAPDLIQPHHVIINTVHTGPDLTQPHTGPDLIQPHTGPDLTQPHTGP